MHLHRGAYVRPAGYIPINGTQSSERAEHALDLGERIIPESLSERSAELQSFGFRANNGPFGTTLIALHKVILRFDGTLFTPTTIFHVTFTDFSAQRS